MFITTSAVSKLYKNGTVELKALDDVAFSAAQGEICVVLGPSGSGKSTLLNVLGGIDRATSGTVTVNGAEITSLNDKALTKYRRNSVGFIFQFYNLIPNLTVYENVEVAAHIAQDPMNIDELLQTLGIADKRDNFPRTLSGGEQQRVSIARALVKRPKLLFCDEPTGALDFDTSKGILKQLSDINRDFGTTIFIITHNNAIAGIGSHIIRLRSGQIAEDSINEHVIPAERIEW